MLFSRVVQTVWVDTDSERLGTYCFDVATIRRGLLIVPVACKL